MNDSLIEDLIDDSGFELGAPTHVEMLQHYNRLLEAELDTTRYCLRKAHKDIAGLIVTQHEGARELTVLKVEPRRLQQTLSDIYTRDSEQETARMG